jgi:hypothetical protein
MVSLTGKSKRWDSDQPGRVLNEQENHRQPVSIRVLHVCWNSPNEYMDVDNGNDSVTIISTFSDPRLRSLFQFWSGTLSMSVLASYAQTDASFVAVWVDLGPIHRRPSVPSSLSIVTPTMVVDHQPRVDCVLLEEKAPSKTICAYGGT